MSAVPAPVFAGFWRRFAAWLLDCIILYFASLLILIALSAVAPRAPDAFYALALIGITLLYFAGCHSSSRQATPGKKALGIKVTDGSGRRIDFKRAVVRYFATWLSAIPLLLGFAMSAFTARKRALHDIVAGTLVVSEAASAEQAMGDGGTMPLTAGVWAAIVVPIAGAIGAAAVAINAFHDYQARASSGRSGAPAEVSKGK